MTKPSDKEIGVQGGQRVGIHSWQCFLPPVDGEGLKAAAVQGEWRGLGCSGEAQGMDLELTSLLHEKLALKELGLSPGCDTSDASSNVQIFDGTDKASVDTSKCLQSIYLRERAGFLLVFLLCSPFKLILVL